MSNPQNQQGCGCANLLVPLMMAVGGTTAYQIGGGAWQILLGVVLGLPAAFLLIIFGLAITVALEGRTKP